MDRVALLSAGRKRRASSSPVSGSSLLSERTNSQSSLLKVTAQKLRRRDSMLADEETNSCGGSDWRLGTQPSQEDLDSAHTTVFNTSTSGAAAPHAAPRHPAVVAPSGTDDLECDDSCCCTDTGELLANRDDMGGEVNGPSPLLPRSEHYIKGTRLIIGGWFQACRGCNEPTAHTAPVSEREVPLCPRCQDKYRSMTSGDYPTIDGGVDAGVEPLCYWLPRMLPPMRPMSPKSRRNFCDLLLMRQDDAWAALVRVS